MNILLIFSKFIDLGNLNLTKCAINEREHSLGEIFFCRIRGYRDI